MAIINRVADGFLALLDTKSQGVTPPNISEEVRPTLEMTPFYAANNGYEIVVGTTTTVAAASIGFQTAAAIEVPRTETWRVLSVSVSTFTLLGGVNVKYAVALRQVGTGTINNHVLSDGMFNQTIGATELGLSGYTFPTPIIMKSGVLIGPWIGSLTAGLDFTTTVLINRL